MLVGQGAVDPVGLLGEHVHPPALVPAGEAGVGPPAAHVVEHGDVLGDPDRVVRREHDAELSDPDALGLHGDEQVEEHRVVRQLEALDVEVVLGEADRVVAELVGQDRLLPQLGQHPVVEITAQAGHAGLDLRPAADGGQIEERHLHDRPILVDGLRPVDRAEPSGPR